MMRSVPVCVAATRFASTCGAFAAAPAAAEAPGPRRYN